MCETAKLSPVPCGVRVAKEADLDSSLALAPAGCRVLGKCLLYFRSLRLLIWKMGILLIAMPVHRNVRSLNEKSQPVVGAQGDGRWRQGVCSVEHVGAEAAMALGPGPLLSTGSVAWCLLTWLWAQCWGARGSPWATTPLA